ncbi:MAG: outer membrane beta-barrel protein [Bacteroidetes bacterium]|nr:outer membrane beta-barrel protein [Bacteroidota bacterium]
MSHPEQHTEQDGLEVFFSKYLKDASMEPSAGSWEMIDQALKAGEKEKRRKRFLWIFFSGAGALLLLGTWLFLSYGSSVSSFFAPSKQSAAASSASPAKVEKNMPAADHGTAETKEKSAAPGAHPDTTPSQESSVSSPAEVAVSEETVTHVQLGAFKHAPKPGMFSKLPFAVLTETGADGLTRYYARIENPEKDLDLIRRSGFKDAFIKQGPVDAVAYHEPMTNSHETGTMTHSAKAEKQPVVRSATSSALTQNQTKSEPNTTPSKSTIPSHGVATPSQTNTAIAVTQTKYTPVTTPENTVTSVASGTQSAGPLSQGQNNTGDAGTTQQQAAGQTTGAVTTTTVTAAEHTEAAVAASDSTKKEPDKKDSTLSKASSPHKDSSITLPYARWAVSLTGGPNVFFNSPSSTGFSIKNEYHPQTYNAHLDLEYRFMPGLSGGIGVSYQEYSTRQDETYFRFSKYISSDYMVQTSGGPLPIDKDVLLQGFYMAAPIDTFFAYYTYAYTQRMVNVPLHLNWYFINKSHIQAYAGIGVNASYMIAQQNRVTLIKEHDRRDLNYNHINGNRFNALLLLSLGCDVRFTKRFYFTVAPGMRYGLTNTANTPGVLFKPFYISGNAGFKFRF